MCSWACVLCVCVCILLNLNTYIHIALSWSTKGCFWPCNLCHFCPVPPVPVAVSLTALLGMLGGHSPTLVMMNCRTNTLPVLVMTRCLNLGGLFACSRCLLCQIWPQDYETSGLSLRNQRRAAFSLLEFAPSTISRGEAENWFLAGRSQPERSCAVKEVGVRECQWSLSLSSFLQAAWGADRICLLNLVPSKGRNKITIVMFWQSKMFLFAGKSLTHVQPCCPLRMSKKEKSNAACLSSSSFPSDEVLQHQKSPSLFSWAQLESCSLAVLFSGSEDVMAAELSCCTSSDHKNSLDKLKRCGFSL